jgi:hypothetical protein
MILMFSISDNIETVMYRVVFADACYLFSSLQTTWADVRNRRGQLSIHELAPMKNKHVILESSDESSSEQEEQQQKQKQKQKKQQPKKR